jgi:uncharacterized protein (TIGR02001 family)
MRKTMKHIVLGSAVASTALFGAAANAGWTANAGAVTNYLWRGVSQTDDGPAVQGGVDYAHDSGFYAGTWMSNVDFDTSGSAFEELELDVYGGFGGGETFTWDVGAIGYYYPITTNSSSLSDTNFWEVYFNGGWQWLSFGLNYTVVGSSPGGTDCDATGNESAFCQGDIYAYVGADFEVGSGVGLGVIVGTYQLEEGEWTPGEDSYIHYGFSVSKGGFTAAIEANDLDGDSAAPDAKDPSAPRLWVGYTAEFDL